MKNSSFLEHPFIDSMIKTIASLTASELHVLRHLRPYNKANQVKIQSGEKEIDFRLDYTKDKVLGIDTALFRMTFDSLIAKALVIDDSVGRWGGGQRDFIKPSQYGVELFKLLDKLDVKSSES